MTGWRCSGGVCNIWWNRVYHHSEYCMPITVSSTLNWALIQAADRLEEPLPISAFSTMVTRKPRSASRTAVRASVEPPPISTTWSADEEEGGAIPCSLLPCNQVGVNRESLSTPACPSTQ